jgi:AraC-like DNA-binding protein
MERIVTRSLGMSPSEWLRRERMALSRRLLRKSGSVKFVSSEVGFRNAGDFAVEFKRWHGVTPSAFIAREIRTSHLEGDPQ